ncbi:MULTISPECIES: nucleotide pyrophosphohydrolase [Thalassospira]|uniref:Nucleotide pyrophosphohydrolase n=1 Tax=Thalassospira povalilytica TaxID=732237 RepID=A0ABX4R924_9PROT|nr:MULTISPECIES: nucleotide pyrophosphohydrolase [Thalassospira]MBO6771366.1 nucleotide pyrophosphohydrolase [Thalassospira sp.]MEE3045920.1 nucleotide pyrophosphohydrolase [Pseudomonadota bacterium]PKR49418.1 nucleotide pyrophosphohydrolase [Thalassospira povalilytica]RCK20358.1 nucleotide pyrophosphohydrolase [Thalassospira profundimaris]
MKKHCENNNARTESQQSICAWAEETFGPVTDPKALWDRAMLEMHELGDAIDQRDLSEIGKEAADVMILLYRLMDQFGLELGAQCDAKMAINRSRNWQSKGDGTGSHI